MVSRRLLVFFLTLLAIAVNSAAVMFWWTTIRLWNEIDRAPILDALDTGPQATLVYDRSGAQLFSFYSERRTYVPLDRISPDLISAVLAAEDQRFFAHGGLDARRIVGAALSNLSARRIVEGGSTITQQLVRNINLNQRRTYGRKLREMLLAAETEARYSKKEILETYLNRVYFGSGFHGIEAAARGYFGKPAADLSPAEGAVIAGLIKAPSVLSPFNSPEKARTRRNYVLSVMRDRGSIDGAQYRHASDSALQVRSPAPGGENRASHPQDTGLYFREEIRRELVERFGEDRVLTGGLRVHTTLDSRLQHVAERIIVTHAAALEKRTRASGGDPLQGSLVALDVRTGHVLAMVGGRNFHDSPFNRVTQSRRQPGSAFKPLVYAAALERGWNPGSTLRNIDAPIRTAQGAWVPGGEHEAQEYTLRRALKVSSNRAAAQLMQAVGVSSALEMAHRLGIRSDLPAVPSLALGTGEVTLFELTSAYSAFANGGVLASPIMVTRVEDPEGVVLWENPPALRRVLSPATAFLITSILGDVVTSGTAAGARAYGFKLPAAGKTGTTNDYADSWFIGYTPQMVTGVWFGFDRPQTIFKRGFASVVAVPAWALFMREATRGDKPAPFDAPPGVERVAICSVSHLLATDACRLAAASTPASYQVAEDGSIRMVPPPAVIEEYFSVGTGPAMPCDVHGYSDTLYDIADLVSPEDPGRPLPLVAPLPVGLNSQEAVGTSGTEPPAPARRPAVWEVNPPLVPELPPERPPN